MVASTVKKQILIRNLNPEALWLSVGVWMLAGQLLAVPMMVGLTFYLQSRKRDFG